MAGRPACHDWSGRHALGLDTGISQFYPLSLPLTQGGDGGGGGPLDKGKTISRKIGGVPVKQSFGHPRLKAGDPQIIAQIPKGWPPPAERDGVNPL